MRTIVHEASELMHLRTAGDTITATPNHPFRVAGRGWVQAGDLATGDTLCLADGGRTSVVSVIREKLSSPVDVYNLEVADFHTYFVATAGVWVHNCGGGAEQVARWSPGDSVNAVTRNGNPAWSTVRSRFWKNEALNNPSEWTESNISRMQGGRAPIGRDGYSMQLHHVKPRAAGGSDDFGNLQAMTQTAHYQLHGIW